VTDDQTDSATLGTAGEVAALRRIFPILPPATAATVGPGDDGAVIATPDGRVVISTDLLVHGPDFRLAWSSPFDLGWKGAATNLADIAAMGGRPTALVVAIAAPLDTLISDLEGIARGLRDACAALAPGVGVVGGDLSASDTLTIAVTVFGDLEGRDPVLRSGARPGDVLALAGSVGRAAAGLRLLFAQGIDDSGEPDAGAASDLVARRPAAVEAQLRPSPPIAAGSAAAIGGATAMLDVSDGLLLDAARIAVASGVDLDIDLHALQPDRDWIAGEAPELSEVSAEIVLTDGEDHSLLATFPADVPLPEGFRAIGVAREGSGHVLVGGADPAVRTAGWDSFAGWDGVAG